MLRTAILTLHHQASWEVGDADGRVGFVDVLTARARGAEGVDADVGSVDGDVFQLIGFRHHRHGTGRCVHTALAFGGRHALHAVGARFKFQLAVHACAHDAHNRFFVAAQIGFAFRHHFGFPTLALGIAHIHAQQIACKQSRFVAARARAHFDEYVFIVVLVFGQQ